MKRPIVISLIHCFAFVSLLAQTKSDSAVYHRGLALLNKAKSTSEFLVSAAYFDSVSIANPTHWLAFYYSGLANTLAAQNADGIKNSDQMLDKAQLKTEKAFELIPEEPELHVLQALIYQVRLLSDPQNRAFSLAQKADASLKRAFAADSSNPRAHFLQGNNVFYTPPMFKGGPKNALPVFLKAREKFRDYTLSLSFMPDWGKQQNEEMIKKCRESKL